MKKSQIAKTLGIKTADILTTAVYPDHIAVILKDYRKKTIPIQRADKLNLIFGLGRTSQDRLIESGILTFEQLAQADPEHLHEITKADASVIERWIADAAKYASGEWTPQ